MYLLIDGSMSICTLRRCQGKRGCVCPKGLVPIGSFGCRKEVTTGDDGDESAAKIISHSYVRKASPSRVHTSSQKAVLERKNNRIRDPKIDGGSGTKSNESSVIPKKIDNHYEAQPMEVKIGSIVARYNHYKKTFRTEDGSTTAAVIDVEYVLSFAFPNCKIHLSVYGPSDFSFEDQGFSTRPCVKEEPDGTFVGLDDGGEYWVVVEEDDDERKAYEARQEKIVAENAKRRAAKEVQDEDGLSQLIVSKSENCSCIEGNPCMDRYCCKDWNNRFEVAKKNGWKGFS